MKTSIVLRVLLGLILAISFLPVQPAAAQVELPAGGDYVPGEILLTYPAGTAPRVATLSAQATAGEVGAAVVASYENIALLSLNPQADVPSVVAAIQASDPGVRAQPNWIYSIPEAATAAQRVITLPENAAYSVRGAGGARRTFTAKQLAAMRTLRKGKSIPAFPREITSNFYQSWGWDLVETDVIWRNSTTSPTVCVIDTGVDANHVDLRGKVINGWDFINDDSLPEDDNGHGTHVAGILIAKNDNTAGTALGVSNGKIVAVKALNAQGSGTAYSVAAAVRYCANRADVRVINLSLGSAVGDRLEYDSLKYAIQDKGKLVVTSAGNGGTSVPDYPAGWAYQFSSLPSGVATNEIYSGLLAVAAARSNPPYVNLWIDTDGSGTMDADESIYGAQDCATRFTNYGRHVEIVAPGDQIYSTQPTSYPFYNNFLYAYAKGYEYDSGTSMAAPYVSAAAARTLSVYKTLTAAQLKSRLINTGRKLNFDYDTGPGVDLDDAYASPGKNYGVVENDLERAPFCWPGSAFGAQGSMTNARYLDVSAAMGRVGFYAEIYNAANGLPLTGARIALTTASSSRTADTGLVGSITAGAFLQNIPLPSETKGSEDYYLWVSKPGYTSGYQYFDGVHLVYPDSDDDIWGGMLATTYNIVAVPPAKNPWVVLTWGMFASANLDLAVWLPDDSAAGGVVNAGRLADYAGPASFTGPDWERGTLLKPEQFGGTESPYAQFMHDGGDGLNSESPLHFDAVQMKDNPARGVQPFYSPSNTSQPYQIFITDYSGPVSGGLGGNPSALFNDSDNKTYASPAVRVWAGGRVLNWDTFQNAPVCAADDDWWHALNLQGSLASEVNVCGEKSILP